MPIHYSLVVTFTFLCGYGEFNLGIGPLVRQCLALSSLEGRYEISRVRGSFYGERFVEVPLQITVQPRSCSHLGQSDGNTLHQLFPGKSWKCCYPPRSFTVLSSKQVDTGNKSDRNSSPRSLLFPPWRDLCNKVITKSGSRARGILRYGIGPK